MGDYRKYGLCPLRLGLRAARYRSADTKTQNAADGSNAAIALLLKAGYVEEGRKHQSVCADGEYVDQVLFGKLLGARTQTSASRLRLELLTTAHAQQFDNGRIS